ncbi:MAG: hypothetical protein V4616_08410 [Bacteroidota bacterium]
MRLQIGFTVIALIVFGFSKGQPVPSASENIDFICTFGKEAEITWGDDDFVQTFFFIVPKTNKEPVYIRIFDPNTGGKHDQLNTIEPTWNTTTRFSVFGGKGAFSNADAQKPFPRGNFKSGVQLFTATFGNENTYDDKWYSFGPLNPAEGEYVKEFDAYVFKIVSESYEGNDGNLYRYFFSQSRSANVPVEGSNAFTYKYTFRLKSGNLHFVYLEIGDDPKSE